MVSIRALRTSRSRHLVVAAGAVGIGLTVLVPLAPAAAHAGPAAPGSAAVPAVAGDGDGQFTIAVLPDTQQEVLSASDTRFTNRAQWLSDNRKRLDLRYVTHSGDVVNWDTADHAQYERTEPGVRILDATGVPWSFSIGNHDTLATGPGGSARPGGDPTVDQRTTTTFNAYYGLSHARALAGTFEAGKIDNSYSAFTAERTRWLVLNLELWPRPQVVDWAAKVVASHPTYNVAIVTHAMLNPDGSVQQDDGGYGATSPQYLLDRVGLKYANVRFVFSGHAGTFGYRAMTGVHGNPVSIVQTTYHDNATNPTRIVHVDVTHDAFTAKVYSPYSAATKVDGSAVTRSGMAWIRG